MGNPLFWIWLGSIVAVALGLVVAGFWLSRYVETGKGRS